MTIEIVHWVHPSVRDLVIEYLASNANERRRFLSRAGPAGVSLALSSGGGASGARTMPLLREHRDWQVLSDRIRSLAGSSSDKDRNALLSIVEATRHSAEQMAPPELAPLIRDLLPAISSGWTSSGAALSPEALGRFFLLSQGLDPLPQSPVLTPTWNRWLGAVLRVNRSFINRSWCSEVDKWIDLIEILRSAEPRFLKGIRFPEDLAQELEYLKEEMVAWVQELPELGALDVDEDDDLIEPDPDEDEELRTLREIGDLLSRLANEFPEVFEEVDLDATIQERLDERDERRSEWSERYEREPDDDYEENPSAQAEPTVAEIFVDL